MMPQCVEEGCVLSRGHTLLGQGDTLLSLEPMWVHRPLGRWQLGQALLPLQETRVGQALVLQGGGLRCTLWQGVGGVLEAHGVCQRSLL